MAAPVGCGGDCRPRCLKLAVGGMWRCNVMAISGNPFCEKHYALEVKKLQNIGIGEFSSGEEEEREVVFGNEGVSLRKRGVPKGSMSKGKEKVLRENDEAAIRIGGRGRERPVKIRAMQGEDQGGDEGNEESEADKVSDGEQVFGYFQVDDVGPKNVVRRGRPIGSKNKKVTRNIRERPEGSRNQERFPIKTRVNGMDGKSSYGNEVVGHKRRRNKRGGDGRKKPALVGTSGVRLSKEEEIVVSGDNIKKRGPGRPRKVDAKHGSNSHDDDVLMGNIFSDNIKKRSRGRSQKRGETSGAGLFKEDEISVCKDNIKKMGRGRPRKVDTKHGLDTCGDDDVMVDIVSEKDIRDVPPEYEESVKRPRGRPKKMVETSGVGLSKEDEIGVGRDNA